MHPVMIQIGSLTIYSYGVMLAIAFGVGIWLAYLQAEECNIEKKVILDLSLYILLASLIGSRGIYILLNLENYLSHPWEIIFSRSGFVFYGGLIFGIIVAGLYLIYYKLPFWRMADLFAPSVAIGEAIGRIGCLLNGCCYGKPTHLGWGIAMPDHPGFIHPTQVYSSLCSLFIFCFLRLWLKKGWRRFEGQIFCWYLILQPLSRFLIEFFRGDNPAILWHLTISQVISSLIGITGLSMMIIKIRL